MILLFIIICIVCVILYNKKDKKDPVRVSHQIAQIPPFTLYAKPLSQFNRFLNLSYNDANELNYFAFSNAGVTIVMKNGEQISNYLSRLSVRFEKYSSYPIKVTVKDLTTNKKLNFYQMTSLFTSDEWELIFGTLTLAGTTYDANIIKYRKLNRNIGIATSIIKFLAR